MQCDCVENVHALVEQRVLDGTRVLHHGFWCGIGLLYRQLAMRNTLGPEIEDSHHILQSLVQVLSVCWVDCCINQQQGMPQFRRTIHVEEKTVENNLISVFRLWNLSYWAKLAHKLLSYTCSPPAWLTSAENLANVPRIWAPCWPSGWRISWKRARIQLRTYSCPLLATSSVTHVHQIEVCIKKLNMQIIQNKFKAAY